MQSGRVEKLWVTLPNNVKGASNLGATHLTRMIKIDVTAPVPVMMRGTSSENVSALGALGAATVAVGASGGRGGGSKFVCYDCCCTGGCFRKCCPACAVCPLA